MEENRTMTAKERAALANAREAEAQRRKYSQSGTTTAPRRATASAPTQKAAQGTAKKQITPERRANTREYPKPPYVRQAQATKRPVKQPNNVQTAPQNTEEKVDTGEFPTYVRAGKGGYHPHTPKKRVVARQHRRKLDPKFKAALLAVGVVIAIIIILLIAGVRYSTYKISSGGEIRFFGIVKGGEPTSGWISSSSGEGGRFKTGIIEYSDGSVYEGGTLNAMRSGEGTLTYANGDVAKGVFTENYLNGKGTVTYSNGDTYEGEFRNSKKHGLGVLKYKTSSGYDVYEGNFENDKRHGQGKMTYSSGDIYEGEFENDLKHGVGTYTHANGRTFEGTYKNNLRYEGKFTFENGAVFEGTFETSITNQMLEGKYTYANGNTVTGRYDKATNSFIAQ